MTIAAFTAEQRARPPVPVEQLTVGLELEVLLPPLPNLPIPEEVPYDEAPPGFCRALAKWLREETGDDYRAPQAVGPGRYGFFVVPEYDLDPLQFPRYCIAGVEITTPPLPFAEAAAAHERLRDTLDLLGAAAHPEVGAHIGLSCNGAGPDPLSMALGVDEEVLLNREQRAGQRGLATQEAAFMPAAIRRGLADPDFRPTAYWISTRLGHGKLYATNLAKLDRDYVELRHWSAETVLFGDRTLQDLVEPFRRGVSMTATQTGDLIAAAGTQARAAANWLRRLDARLQVRTRYDTRDQPQSVLEAAVEIDGMPYAVFSESPQGATLRTGPGPRNTAARERHDVEFAAVRETFAHMILMEARHSWRFHRDEPVKGPVYDMLECLDELDALPEPA